jgi:heme-degrading monooxygenase HmoA
VIIRIWHGWTTPENAEEYEQLVVEENYEIIAEETGEGYRGFEMARNDRGDEIEYVTITRFDSWEAVESFAGEDYEEAYVPPKAQDLLTRYDERVDHYEVTASEKV